jgi:ribosomal-protein-alanine N-acetyltransferase
VRYLANRVPWPYPEDGALQYCRDTAVPEMESGQAWHWTIRLADDSDRVIDLISLTMSESENRGFWLGVPWQGNGYMTEACEWVTDYWFGTLGFLVRRVPKAAANISSRRISEKQGMRLVSVVEKDYVCGRLPSEIWEITAEEWRAWRARKKPSDN